MRLGDLMTSSGLTLEQLFEQALGANRGHNEVSDDEYLERTYGLKPEHFDDEGNLKPGVWEQQVLQLCDKDEFVGEAFHKHLCECGTCWKHALDVVACPQHRLEHDYKFAHACPSCGKQVREKHWSEAEKKEYGL